MLAFSFIVNSCTFSFAQSCICLTSGNFLKRERPRLRGAGPAGRPRSAAAAAVKREPLDQPQAAGQHGQARQRQSAVDIHGPAAARQRRRREAANKQQSGRTKTGAGDR